MGVQKGDTISLHYSGRFNDGEEFDNSFSREPIVFTVGTGQVVEAIDKGVIGLEPGEQRNIHVTPDTGFGERHDELLREVPRSLLGDQGVAPGEAMEIQTEDGQMLIALVNKIDDEKITVDLNHPLSGKVLDFEVQLVNIQQRAA